MAQGLSVSDIVSVSIMLSPTAIPNRNFGVLLILGSSPVIDVNERMRTYTSLPGVGQDFGTDAPEYKAAAAFFGQSPMPYMLKIGRYAQQPTSGVMHGAPLNPYAIAANLAALQGLSNGALTVTIDGVPKVMTNLAFGGAANMNGVAAVVAAALGATGGCVWDGSRFSISSKSAGTLSTVGTAITPSGADVALLLGVSAAAAGPAPIGGMPTETAVQALQVFSGMTGDFYAVTFAPLVPMTDTAMLQVAATVEGTSPVRVLGITTQAPATLDGTSQTDLASILHASGYSRTVVQYSSTNPYAIASFFGRALSVNFEGSRTTLTMMFKQEPGVVPELLTETQSGVLTTKCANVFVSYQNGAAIVQNGTVSNGRFFDEVMGLDWLSYAVQNDLWNILYQAKTKIPQTDEGVHLLYVQIESTLATAVENGLLAPGIWNAEGFGQLSRGDLLPKGFYVYAPLVASQNQADREARKAPLMQAAVKMAGAIHSVNCIISVNR